MTCPKCGSEMKEISKWEKAPYGGWKCPNCNLEIPKLTSSKINLNFSILAK